ncbi:hypothetical protein ACIGCM_20535 [Pseudomonas sp. NPDC078700]|uniref:hypothetical protein n=1 Tax=Pseudomonas sp. NPDC078700 TaxID=3364424 RepID=UPI0037C8A4FB
MTYPKTFTHIPRLAVFLLLLCLAQTSVAANQPCSGKKGGIARCDGELFVCNDSSISGSKRNCSAELNGGASAPLRVTGSAGECPCGSGTLCTGPKGGRYCLTSGGNKSYKRK